MCGSVLAYLCTRSSSIHLVKQSLRETPKWLKGLSFPILHVLAGQYMTMVSTLIGYSPKQDQVTVIH